MGCCKSRPRREQPRQRDRRGVRQQRQRVVGRQGISSTNRAENQPLLREDDSGSPPLTGGFHRALHSRDFLQQILEDAYAAQVEADMRINQAAMSNMVREAQINRLPSTPYTTAMRQSVEAAECTICMEEYLDGQDIRFLPCLHMYHKTCVDDWLMRNFNCPLCGIKLDEAAGSNS
eukprot:m.17992 g.17992  ORF g.17992 m.17992 type:complete len:176 (-) comp6161_c0_seq2:247-774(-)